MTYAVITFGCRVNQADAFAIEDSLRARGLTFYQYQMDAPNHNTVLQVVRNPSRTLPYVSCALVAFGLLIQFGLSLEKFIGRRKASPTPAA